MINHHAIHLALRNHALPALPAHREWENVQFHPTPNQPYVEEDYVPATSQLIGGSRSGGRVEDTALYVLRWYDKAGVGTKAINDGITALLARFTPGTTIIATDDTVIRVRGDVAPTRGQIINVDGGWAMAPVTIPVRIYTQNPA